MYKKNPPNKRTRQFVIAAIFLFKGSFSYKEDTRSSVFFLKCRRNETSIKTNYCILQQCVEERSGQNSSNEEYLEYLKQKLWNKEHSSQVEFGNMRVEKEGLKVQEENKLEVHKFQKSSIVIPKGWFILSC